MMAQTHRQTHTHKDGHGNSMTNLAQRGQVGENIVYQYFCCAAVICKLIGSNMLQINKRDWIYISQEKNRCSLFSFVEAKEVKYISKEYTPMGPTHTQTDISTYRLN